MHAFVAERSVTTIVKDVASLIETVVTKDAVPAGGGVEGEDVGGMSDDGPHCRLQMPSIVSLHG